MHVFVEYGQKYEVGLAITEIHDAVTDFLHVTNRFSARRQRQMPARIVCDLRRIIKGVTASPHRKCGTADKDLWRTFLTGMNGTPMPSFADTVTPEDAWHLVHFLKSLQVRTTEQSFLNFSVGQ